MYAEALAYISSMLKDENVKAIKVGRVYQPSGIPQQDFAIIDHEDDVGEDTAEDFAEDDILSRENEDEDFSNEENWRTEVHIFLEQGALPADVKQARKVQPKAGRYQLRGGILYKKSFLVSLLRNRILKDIHYGDAGNHSGMRSLADKDKMQGYYWPQMIWDADMMTRRCEECQRFAKRIHAPET
ncbi:uncharacterized protein LOC113324791 [Papaver somniferum]|uniref:uncharacterized protein LOC113324791 n=1 Tax=Papaver somniferum TaxID=3469 RepID=UPI000E6FEE3E|nr:uncharacterized protein LOC113324791 [Papaver somniferum]